MLNIKKILSKLKRKPDSAEKENAFVSLAPTDAFYNKTTFNALNFALDLKNKAIHNIAISGPFGAGKSSVWKSYKNIYKIQKKKKILEISLARFDDERYNQKKKSNCNDNKENETIEYEVEKNILQQMLFSVEKDNVPCLDSFKFSSSEKLQYFFTIITFLAAFLTTLFVIEPETLILFFNNNLSYSYEYCIIYALFAIMAFIFTFSVIKPIYKFIVKAKETHVCNLSFKDLNISFDETKESLINRNYKAIVYFFEKTKKNIVVFEDIDRFSSNKIFVKLRELNTLLNNCPKLKDKIKFIYMVREDLFTKYERTKFFDMIIPILPIVNMDSCTDYLLKLKKDEENASNCLKNVGDELIRIVGGYINDLRIIKDCLNEFKIYKAQLEKDIGSFDGLDEKIFAMIVYKNYYPQDFERLHRHKGILYNIIKNFMYANIKQEKNDDGSISVINDFPSFKSKIDEPLNKICEDTLDGAGKWVYRQCLKLELKFYDDDSDSEQKAINNAEKARKQSLLFDLLLNESIDANCEFYISRKHNGDFGPDDYNYLIGVMSGNCTDFNLKIQKPKLIERKISKPKWSSISVLNNRMVAYELYSSSLNNTERSFPIIPELIKSIFKAERLEINFFSQFLDFLENELKNKTIVLEGDCYTTINSQGFPDVKEILYEAIYENMDSNTLFFLFKV